MRLLAEEGHEVAAAVGDGDALIAAVAQGPPDVVVVDVRMPPTHTDEGCAPRWRSGGAGRTSACSSCRSTWRSATPPS